MLLLCNEDIEQVLRMDRCIDVIEQSYIEMARGDAVNKPPVLLISETSVEQAAQELGMTAAEVTAQLPGAAASAGGPVAYVLKMGGGLLQGLGMGALRITSELVGYPVVAGKRRKVKLPLSKGFQYCSLVLLVSARNGHPIAIMPDGYMFNDLMIAAKAAVATKYLARPDASVLGMIGAGKQAEKAVLATAAVRDLKQILVFSPRPESRERFAEKLQGMTGIPVTAYGDPETVVRSADIVVTATNALQPVIRGDWLRSGTHFTRNNLKEVGPDCFERVDLVVTTWNGLGGTFFQEYMVPNAEGHLEKEYVGKEVGHQGFPEVGDVITGKHPGRTSPEQITFHDNMTAGVEFAAVGAELVKLAREQGLGLEVPDKYFLHWHR